VSSVDRLVTLWWVAVTAVVTFFHLPSVAGWLGTQMPTVQAAIYAAAIAIFGVIINNFVSAWNASRQLQHDREKHEADQKMGLRRGIYLGLAETIRDGFNAIMWWADPGREHKEIVEARRQAGKYAAQVHFMGSPALVAATLECERIVDEAAVRVRIRRDQYNAECDRMLALRRRIDSHRANRDAAIETLKSTAIKGALPQAEFNSLQRLAEHAEELAQPLAVQHDDILAKLPALRWQLWNFARSEQRAAIPALLKLVEAARSELGESIDMSVYQMAISQLTQDDKSDIELQQLFRVPLAESDATTSQ
jgi:hypothetical protein